MTHLRTIRSVLNWLAVLFVGVAAALATFAGPHTPNLFGLTALVGAGPFVLAIFASAEGFRRALRLSASAANMLGALVFGSLAAVALTGLGGAFALFPPLAMAAALSVWNAAASAWVRRDGISR